MLIVKHVSIIIIECFVIGNFRGTCSSVKMLKGYMLICWNTEGVHCKKKVGNPCASPCPDIKWSETPWFSTAGVDNLFLTVCRLTISNDSVCQQHTYFYTSQCQYTFFANHDKNRHVKLGASACHVWHAWRRLPAPVTESKALCLLVLTPSKTFRENRVRVTFSVRLQLSRDNLDWLGCFSKLLAVTVKPDEQTRREKKVERRSWIPNMLKINFVIIFTALWDEIVRKMRLGSKKVHSILFPETALLTSKNQPNASDFSKTATICTVCIRSYRKSTFDCWISNIQECKIEVMCACWKLTR